MRRGMRWLLAVLIPLGVFLVAIGVFVATGGPEPFVLVLLVTAPLSIIYPCVVLGRLGWRLLRGRPLRPLVTQTKAYCLGVKNAQHTKQHYLAIRVTGVC